MDDKVDYSIDKGLIFMLAGLAQMSKKEVWAELADATRVCTERIKKKKTHESWRWFEFPNTTIKMKVKVGRRSRRNKDTGASELIYKANIKLDRNGMECFTSEEVNEFLIEELLLGDEEPKSQT